MARKERRPHLDSLCMWSGPSIGIIIKDLARKREGRGDCRCTSDVGLVPGSVLPVGAPGGI